MLPCVTYLPSQNRQKKPQPATQIFLQKKKNKQTLIYNKTLRNPHIHDIYISEPSYFK